MMAEFVKYWSGTVSVWIFTNHCYGCTGMHTYIHVVKYIIEFE